MCKRSRVMKFTSTCKPRGKAAAGGTQGCGFGAVSYLATVCSYKSVTDSYQKYLIYLFAPGAVYPFSTAHSAVAQIVFNHMPKVKNLLELLMFTKEPADLC